MYFLEQRDFRVFSCVATSLRYVAPDKLKPLTLRSCVVKKMKKLKDVEYRKIFCCVDDRGIYNGDEDE